MEHIDAIIRWSAVCSYTILDSHREDMIKPGLRLNIAIAYTYI